MQKKCEGVLGLVYFIRLPMVSPSRAGITRPLSFPILMSMLTIGTVGFGFGHDWA